jgi:hypothetical protein
MCDKYNIEGKLKEAFMKISRLLIEQNYFKFLDTVYLQKEGLAMGAPTSSMFSEIYLQYIENTEICYPTGVEVEGYYHCVDDILVVYRENLTNINNILDKFNNIMPNMKFTLEQEQDNRIHFLDVTLIKKTKTIYSLTYIGNRQLQAPSFSMIHATH